MAWPAEALHGLGHDIRVFTPGVQEHLPISDLGDRIKLLAEPDFDVIIVQRPLQDTWWKALQAFRDAGVRVVVDLDDDLWALRADHVGYWHVHPKTSPDHNWTWVAKAMRHADTVTVTTEALRQRCLRFCDDVRVVPNGVPAAYLSIEPVDHDGVVVGWPGDPGTHPGDLGVLGPSIRQLVERTGARFNVIGIGDGVDRILGVDVDVYPWVPMNEYPAALTTFDVGVVPLLDHPFNQSKSWLKGLEMAAVGVPFVASPTGPYRLLAEEGAGLLADKPKHWLAHLTRLVNDPDERAQVAAAGRQVAARWTIEARAGMWADAWLKP